MQHTHSDTVHSRGCSVRHRVRPGGVHVHARERARTRGRGGIKRRRARPRAGTLSQLAARRHQPCVPGEYTGPRRGGERECCCRSWHRAWPVQRAVLEAVTGRGLLFTAPLGEAGPQRQSAGVGKCSPNFVAGMGPRPSSEVSLASARPTRDTLDRLRGGTGRGRECGCSMSCSIA